MLNPALYRALQERFGDVHVVNEGVQRVARRYQGERQEKVEVAGEHYNVCCPACNETRFRCSISHAWLSRGADGRPRADLIHCFNEDCQDLYRETFWGPFEKAVKSGEAMARMQAVLTPPLPPPEPMRLPEGCVPLHELPGDHIAHRFILEKYRGNLDPMVLGREYAAQWTETYDERFRGTQNRIIFPIYENGKLVSWQGRTVNPLERRRWYLPPGFSKVVYRFDSVPANHFLVLSEGITSSIACGPDGGAIFGKQLDDRRAQQIASKFQRVVIATDPETFEPCYHDVKPHQKARVLAQEMKDLLDKYLHYPAILLRWPDEALAAARERNKAENKSNKEIRVPDPADYGPAKMGEIIASTIRQHMGLSYV